MPLVTRAHSVPGGADFFSVRMSGGGTLFLSGDTDCEPVIAFTSADVDFDSLEEGSPLRALLVRDARVRGRTAAVGKWDGLLASGDVSLRYPLLRSLSASPLSEPGDIRVPALIGSRWGQCEDRSGHRCFNLYTPSNSVCGCVATAMSQIMRYHRWPDALHPVEAKTFSTYFGVIGNAGLISESELPLTLQGGVYDWDLMPTDADGDRVTTDAQREAISKLTSDVGISSRMYYTLSSSAAYSVVAVNEFMDTWHYGQATYFDDDPQLGGGYATGSFGSSERRLMIERSVFSNLDAGFPVMVGIVNDSSGHAVVADGYGYDGGVDYIHLNMGWNGQYDLWYNLPDVESVQVFDTVTEIVYNVFPTNDTSCAALSGRVLDMSSQPVAGASVTVSSHGTGLVVAELESSSTGVYGAVLPVGEYDIVAVSPDRQWTGTADGVRLASPSAKERDYGCVFMGDVREEVTCKRSVKNRNDTGNSWGNDIVLDIGNRTDPADFFVSVSSGVDAPDRGTSDAPYATIQYAITNGQLLVAGDVINVLPGTYYGCVETPEVPVTIVSTDGPEVTLIDGEGLDCCYDGNANPANVLSGFTITNGAYYGGVFFGTATNCVIVGCTSTASLGFGSYYGGGGAYSATLHGCVLHNNEAYYGGGAASCTLVNCTVYDNWACYAGGGVDYGCTVTNSIVWRNRVTDDDVIENWGRYEGHSRTGTIVHCPSFAYSCTYPDGFTDLGGNITNDPMCVSFDVDDWRLRIGSPCAGSALGGLNMGAWQDEPIVGYVITAEVSGRGHVSPRSQFVLAGEDVVFTAEGDHPFLGFETNGVLASAARVFVWQDVRADGDLRANFGVTNYCIDAVSGDDVNDGLSWAMPLRTIYAMTQKAGRGDTVKVKPGVYDGCSWCVFGVEVESTDGPEVTVIDGGGTNRCIYANDMTYRGFTLRNGNGGTSPDTSYGGGALYGTFVDCVFTNCTAAFGGAAAGSTLTNCLVVGNSAERHRSGSRYQGGCGGGVYECDIVNSTVAGNTAYSYGGGAYLHSQGEARNSIVCGNVSTSGEAYGNDVYGNHYWTLSNTVVDVDARFRDAANGDYRLQPLSPALDAGSADYVAVDRDLAGTNRVWGGAVDCGCYEYHLPSPLMTDPTGIGIASALSAEGYSAGFADAVKTPGDYAYLLEWTANNGLAASEVGASPTAFLSPALGAAGLLELSPGDIDFQSFTIADTNLSIAVLLPGYDGNRVHLPLLESALGIVGSENPEGPYSSDGLECALIPGRTNLLFSITIRRPCSRYFFRSTVR